MLILLTLQHPLLVVEVAGAPNVSPTLNAMLTQKRANLAIGNNVNFPARHIEFKKTALAECGITLSPNHEVLTFTSASLNSFTLRLIRDVLPQWQWVTTIKFTNCHFVFNVAELQTLGTALAQCRRLVTVDLSGSWLGRLNSEQLEALAAGLRQCRYLQNLLLPEVGLQRYPMLENIISKKK